MILLATKLPALGQACRGLRPSCADSRVRRQPARAGRLLRRQHRQPARLPRRGLDGKQGRRLIPLTSGQARPADLACRHRARAAGAAGALVQKSEDRSVYAGQEQQQRLRGWLSAGLEGGGSLAVGLDNFREQFPKAVARRPEAINIDLWAEEGGEFEWIEGVGKTHHLSLYYGSSAAADAGLLAEGRILALATPQWEPPASGCACERRHPVS